METAVVTLSEFLLARIAEDEHDAEMKRQVVEHAPESVLRMLTVPYADHPDYRAEWRY
jgi:hypothetical protein